VIRCAAAIYRRLIGLYPDAFRRTFGDELEGDFEDGSREAYEAGGVPALLRYGFGVAIDLAVSLAREWLRTPWPVVIVLASALAFSLFAYTAFKVRQWPQSPVWPARSTGPSNAEDLHAVVVLAIGAFIPIAGTIVGSVWMRLVGRSRSRSRRRV
jgi:hypothetical protein